jgi:integrase
LVEVEALFAAAPDAEWRALMHIAFYGGLRLTDAVLLRWRNVDLLANQIAFKPRKTSRTGKTLTIPTHPKLHAQLEALPSADDPEARIIPGLATRQRQELARQFAAIMKAAGVGRMAATESAAGERKFYRRSFHSFRHSLTSALAAQDVPQELRMKLLGHSSASVHAAYTHTEIETLKNALEKLS